MSAHFTDVIADNKEENCGVQLIVFNWSQAMDPQL